MSESTDHLKSMIHEAFNLQENTLTCCQYRNRITNQRCSMVLSLVSTNKMDQIILAFALQAPSNQQRDDIAVQRVPIIATLNNLAQNALCTLHNDAESVSRKVLQWLGSAAYKVNLFTLHPDLRSAIRDTGVLLPSPLGNAFTTDTGHALNGRTLLRRQHVESLRCTLYCHHNMHDPAFGEIEGYIEHLVEEPQCRSTVYDPDLNLNHPQHHYPLDSIPLIPWVSETVALNPPPIPARSPLRIKSSDIHQALGIETWNIPETEGAEERHCSICHDSITDLGTTCVQCHNRFHWPCIEKWATARRRGDRASILTCPLCRSVWFDQDIGLRQSLSSDEDNDCIDDGETRAERVQHGEEDTDGLDVGMYEHDGDEDGSGEDDMSNGDYEDAYDIRFADAVLDDLDVHYEDDSDDDGESDGGRGGAVNGGNGNGDDSDQDQDAGDGGTVVDWLAGQEIF